MSASLHGAPLEGPEVTPRPATSPPQSAGALTLLGGVIISHPEDVAFVRSLPEGEVLRLGRLLARLQSPLQKQLSGLRQDNARANREQRRQYPDHRMIALAEIRKMLPQGVISNQAVWKWCIEKKVKAEQRDGLWFVEPDSFLSHWESSGFAPMQCRVG